MSDFVAFVQSLAPLFTIIAVVVQLLKKWIPDGKAGWVALILSAAGTTAFAAFGYAGYNLPDVLKSLQTSSDLLTQILTVFGGSVVLNNLLRAAQVFQPRASNDLQAKP